MQKTDTFVFFIDFMEALINSLDKQASVTAFRSTNLGIDIQFEVHVKQINGKRLGRVTEAQAARINANRSPKP